MGGGRGEGKGLECEVEGVGVGELRGVVRRGVVVLRRGVLVGSGGANTSVRARTHRRESKGA